MTKNQKLTALRALALIERAAEANALIETVGGGSWCLNRSRTILSEISDALNSHVRSALSRPRRRRRA